jgi:hypothetical protein
VISKDGIVIRTRMDQIRMTGRAAQGVSVINVAAGDSVASLATIEMGNGGPTAGGPKGGPDDSAEQGTLEGIDAAPATKGRKPTPIRGRQPSTRASAPVPAKKSRPQPKPAAKKAQAKKSPGKKAAPARPASRKASPPPRRPAPKGPSRRGPKSARLKKR